jgi:acetylornithine/N-succinyldiaminopimelate aminotransferase
MIYPRSPVMETYSRLPVSFTHGDGVWLWSADGRRFLDAIAGIAVCNLGHAHPGVTQAICEQASRLLHTSNLFLIDAQQRLAAELCNLSGMDNVFFGNSGAEANEAAIKIARRHGHLLGIKNPAIVVMENSFHGRTLATLAATGNRKVQAGFEPLVQGFVRTPYNDIEALIKVADSRSDVVAILVEPIQGEAGVIIPSAGYLRALRELCDEQGWLLMLDEVQTGIGRTGPMFAFQSEAIKPDVLTLAKALGNGVPIGACLASGDAATALGIGSHGSTFGGNPLACAAASAVLSAIEDENLLPQATSVGAQLAAALEDVFAGFPGFIELRSRGLMLGLEFAHDCTALPRIALDQGLLVNVTSKRVVRLLPPLVLTEEEADLLVHKLRITLGLFYDAEVKRSEASKQT